MHIKCVSSDLRLDFTSLLLFHLWGSCDHCQTWTILTHTLSIKPTMRCLTGSNQLWGCICIYTALHSVGQWFPNFFCLRCPHSPVRLTEIPHEIPLHQHPSCSTYSLELILNCMLLNTSDCIKQLHIKQRYSHTIKISMFGAFVLLVLLRLAETH